MRRLGQDLGDATLQRLARIVLEAHRDYMDIQTVLVGAEGMEWCSADGLEVETPYDASKDVVLYNRPHQVQARIDLSPGTFAALFPQDAHLPQIIAGNAPELVKKVVIKMKLSLLNPEAR